ncbi:MAG: hypothetical protein ACXVBW_08240, partial [Bdellovibrionota bacterium]
MKKLVTLIGLLSSLNLMSIDRAQAGLLALPTLTQAQMAPIFETMAAALSYRAVEPASSAKWWALGIGVRLTLINATSIASVVGSPIPIPAADISAVVQLPLGLGVELGYLPPLTLFAGTSIQLIGGNVKWTFTNIISDNFPIDICVRAMYTNASFSYTQAVSGVNTSVGYGANMYGGSVG